MTDITERPAPRLRLVPPQSNWNVYTDVASYLEDVTFDHSSYSRLTAEESEQDAMRTATALRRMAEQGHAFHALLDWAGDALENGDNEEWLSISREEAFEALQTLIALTWPARREGRG